MALTDRLFNLGRSQTAVIPTPLPTLVPVLTARPLQQRSLPEPDPEGSLADLINRLRGSREIPWRVPSTREAMGVPAIFRSVTMISNLIGSMAMRVFRDSIELPADDRPQLVKRPDPRFHPREFYRQTGYSAARYGEFNWWVAARDGDGQALALIVANPREVVITENDKNPLFPRIEWRGQVIRNSDWVHVKMTGDVGALRGEGPLQVCQAATSITVEAQEWAANLYALGGYPSVFVKTSRDYDDDELSDFKDNWVATPNNMPRVGGPAIDEIQELGKDTDRNQMLEARNWQVGDVARMFGIPGKLLEYAMQGSSLTYQNIGQVFDDFLRTTLGPDYLEPIEQAMSDLLPRRTVAEFNRAELLKPDANTTANIAATLYEKGVTEREESRAIVGLEPDIENAPVPFSAPAAFPTALPQRSLPEPVRCTGRRMRQGRLVTCGKLLAEQGPFVGTCPRCKQVYEPVAA